jgi:hypothetical protein
MALTFSGITFGGGSTLVVTSSGISGTITYSLGTGGGGAGAVVFFIA